MLMRKINAVTSLVTTLLLLTHAILNAVRMLSFGSIASNVGYISWILVGFMALHAFISIDLVISTYMETENSGTKCKSYPKMNIPTVIQRVSGVLLVLFTVLHVAGAGGYMKPPLIVHAILPPLFFALSLIHTAVSASKAFITLGIGDAKFIKAADIAIKVICVVTFVADIVGFYLYSL